ncbi:MAG: hypothetical protein CSYNP_01271 [Syntrophus sp. SKADARSKE-3]|nr:hypothetical protein [Syntrophus sp. SKADARSKE-3]
MLWGILVISLSFMTVALIPMAGAVVFFLTPLPIFFFMEKLGRFKGFVSFTISLLIAGVILRSIGTGGGIGSFVILGCFGIFIYEILRKNLSIEKTIVYTVLAGTSFFLLILLVYSIVLQQMPWTLIGSYITRSFQESIELSVQIGAQSDQIKFLKDNMRLITRSVLYLFPALTLVGICSVVCLNILIGRRIFLANGLAYPDFGELTRWKAPDRLVWFLIASGGIVLIPSVFGFDIMELIVLGLNIAIVCLFVYFIQGLAIFEFLFKAKRVPRILCLLFYAILMIQQYLMIVVIAAGLFDLWFDFRHLTPRPQEPEDNIES